MKKPEDIALIYAGQVMQHDKALEEYNVPPVSRITNRIPATAPFLPASSAPTDTLQFSPILSHSLDFGPRGARS